MRPGQLSSHSVSKSSAAKQPQSSKLLTMGIVKAFAKQNMMTSHQTSLSAMSGGTTHKAMACTEEQIGVII
jgi:hypothetical protein